MKLTGELKKKVENTKSKEEAKELIAQAGMELTDEEVEMVAGGLRHVKPSINALVKHQAY